MVGAIKNHILCAMFPRRDPSPFASLQHLEQRKHTSHKYSLANTPLIFYSKIPVSRNHLIIIIRPWNFYIGV